MDDHQFPDDNSGESRVTISPDSTYRVVLAYKQPVMSFSSGATVIGLYKGNKLVDEKFYSESFYDVDIEWVNNRSLAMYKYAVPTGRFDQYINCFKTNSDKMFGDEVRIIPRISSDYELIKTMYSSSDSLVVSEETVQYIGERISKGVLTTRYYIPRFKNQISVTIMLGWKCKLEKDSVIVYQGEIKFSEP